MRGAEDVLKWPFLVYDGIEFGRETNNRNTDTGKEWERETACLCECGCENVEGPIASCDYLARSLVSGVFGTLHTNVCACGGDETLEEGVMRGS